MKRSLSAVLILVTATATFGDAIDDAEAKRRGVPVERVQLERSQARVASLEQQVQAERETAAKLAKELRETRLALDEQRAAAAKLQDQIDALKGTLSPAQKSDRARIDEAIKKGEVVVGMTMDDIKKIGGEPIRKISESTAGAEYLWYVYRDGASVGNFTGIMRDGKVVSVDLQYYVARPPSKK